MSDKKNPHELTPMQRQYQEIKSRHRDKILLFRLGDFYEMFDEDAQEASAILHLALTKRHENPMCGFPHHAADQYIRKLIQAGRKVAICDQVEDPALAKGIVKRSIVNIITPGTLIEENYIQSSANNWLAVICGSGDLYSLSLVDISTGEFYVHEAQGQDLYRSLRDELSIYQPAEILYHQDLNQDKVFLDILSAFLDNPEPLPAWYFDHSADEDWHLSMEIDKELWSEPINRASICGAVHYLMETKFCALAHVRRIAKITRQEYMELDDFTLKNLELLKNMQDGSRKYTLLDVLDFTRTPMGSRLIRRWIVMPLYDLSRIFKRQNCVEEFFEDSQLRTIALTHLKGISDVERLTTRIALRKALPRDLKALEESLKLSRKLKDILKGRSFLSELAGRYSDLDELTRMIGKALVEEPSNLFNGNVIVEGYNPELDEYRVLLREGKDWIIRLQEKERKRTGINSLKVKYNKVFGYFIEISKANLDSIPDDYLRKQSLVNAERFTLPELSDYEAKITHAEEKVTKLEQELFEALVDEAARFIPLLQETAQALAETDVFLSLSVAAREFHYCKPLLSQDGDFEIKDGRHPVVEKYMGTNLFVPNDCVMNDNEQRILIITGPNMAGKSTYLRQNALIALMAQMGSYVPAASARMGLLDRIFTRIGASDQLSAGRSTFLVEMEEAANILSHSTRRSLIIMDELGRGTSTYDGLSIAWAVIEYLHEHREKGGKTLFATHYHELTRLSDKPGICNFNIAVREYQDELVFLRKVLEGPADRSYGIYVAKLAGIDQEIIERAGIILENLEKEGRRASDAIERKIDNSQRKQNKSASGLELFSENPWANLAEKIRNLDINRITPLEAITFLHEIKKDL